LKYILNTATCIDLVRGEQEVVLHMESQSPDDCGISLVTAYELYSGVLKCKKPREERLKVELLLRTVHAVEFDQASAWRAAQVRHDLEGMGQRIGPYDLLLAGQALSRDVILVTSNSAEFSRVPGLRLENWRRGR